MISSLIESTRRYNPPPMHYKNYLISFQEVGIIDVDYSFYHDDYKPTKDDKRCGVGSGYVDCMHQIDKIIKETQ